MLKVAVILTSRNMSDYVLCPSPRHAAVVTAVYTHTAHHSGNAHTVFFCVLLVGYVVYSSDSCSQCSAAT